MFMNNVRNRRGGIALLAAALFSLTGAARAQEESAASAEIQANNPLARYTSFNVHNYYIGERTDMDEKSYQFWLRFLEPFSIGKTNWILRALLTTSISKTAIGDLNLSAVYDIDTGNPAVKFGAGPQLTVPTATKDDFGSEKWSAGLVNTLFDMRSPKFQYGYLLSWQGSFAGEDSRADVNLGTFQPFLFYQLGGGTYLRSTAICAYNFENSTYSVPIGLGIGWVIPREKVVFNIFVEPQVSIADKGAGWPEWQIFFGLNTQFK